MSSKTSKYLGGGPVFVAGGSRGVGYEFVKQLSSLGIPTQTLVRTKEAKELLASLPNVKSIIGDAFDENAVQKAMEGCIAAVTTLGGKAEDNRRVDYLGNSNVVEQAGILGVERIVMVTTVGCGPTKGAVSKEVYSLLQEAIEAKNKAERDLRMYTNLDWTIIRPGGLKSEPATGNGILTEDPMASGTINREDLARLLVKVLGSDGLCTRRELTAIDLSQPSSSLNPSINPFPL